MAKKSPFDVKLSDDKRRDLTTMLCEAIRNELQARDRVIADNGLIDFAYSLYEQERQAGISRDVPSSGGADLTSPIAMENVDSLAARAVKTIFQEPLWIVDGIGAENAEKAPVVEEYMQHRQERIRLQKTCGKWFRRAFIEEGAVLEVCEDVEPIAAEEVVKAAVARNPDDTELDPRGSIIVGEDAKPIPLRDDQGALVPPQEADEFVEVHRKFTDYRRRGASLRLHSMKDFLFLPGHAQDEHEVYGQAFRFWRRLDQLEDDAARGEYDEDAIAALGTSQERDTRAEHTRQNQDVIVDHAGRYVDKELWRVQMLANLDGEGFCFYIITISVLHEQILRVKKDWLRKWRGVYAGPYQRTYSMYAYSLILGKLITTIEEHTAWRNMNADRGTLKANAPLKVMQNETWDPELQPFGAGQTIRVLSKDGISTFEFDDIPQGAFNREQQCVTDANRIIGLNDLGFAQLSTEDRTLGENQMAQRESYQRTDDPIGILQEAMEEVGELVHAIEVKTLEEMEERDETGRDVPMSVVDRIKQRGAQDFDGRITSDMIAGNFIFKPRGSVESADPHRRQQMMIGGLNLLAQWAKVNPALGERLASPEMAEALLQWFVTEFKPRDKKVFLAPVQQPMMAPGPPGTVPPPGGGEPLPFPGAPGAAGPSFGGEDLIQQLVQNLQSGGPQQ